MNPYTTNSSITAIPSLLEWPYLVLLNITNTFYNLGLYLQEIVHFYPNPHLRRLDWLWHSRYWRVSPFQISQRDRKRLKLDPHLTVYGETPWTTLKEILDSLPLTPQDRFYELVPAFVASARWLAQKLAIEKHIQIHCQNGFEADLSGATILYITGTTYEDQQIAIMEEKLKEIQAGCWVINLSYPLECPGLELIAEMDLSFSWGAGSVYVHRKRTLVASNES